MASYRCSLFTGCVASFCWWYPSAAVWIRVFYFVIFSRQVSVVGETVNVTGQSSLTPIKVPICHLSDDMGQLFERSPFSDVTLYVGDRQFHVHKAILAGEHLIIILTC